MKYLKRFIIVITVIFCFSCPGAENRTYVNDISEFNFMDGDILLQQLPGSLCKLIEGVTKSKYSHCGIVVHKRGRIYVLEGFPPRVHYTPIKLWINRGKKSCFTQIRVKDISREKMNKVLKEAAKYLRRKYDFQYQIGDGEIYCSELVYKAFKRGINVEVGKKQTLGSLNWRPYEYVIRTIAKPKGSLPLDRVLITPVSLVQSENVEQIYSSFPKDKENKNIQ